MISTSCCQFKFTWYGTTCQATVSLSKHSDYREYTQALPLLASSQNLAHYIMS